MRSRALAALLAAGLAVVGACSSGQDPGIDQQIETPDPTGSTVPPQHMQPCPDGGPDATTPAAGCLDDDGNVVRP